ncbi:hypothetical protein ACFL0K_02935, partial [Patescibacteria group bacterium]
MNAAAQKRSFLMILVSITFFFFALFATAYYAPGETLNPSCAPGDVDCDVLSLLTDNGSYLTTTSGEYISIPYLTSTSTSATSTFAGGVDLAALN